MIEIKNLHKSFKENNVLKNVNCKIETGSIFGLVGINGAGKSTLLRLISGIYKADFGSILVDGEEIYENEKKKADFFFLPDEPYYNSNTTPISIVEIYKALYDFDESLYYEYLNKFKIQVNKKMNNFSKGMKRQVFISMAFAIKPKYLLLDEAFDGLDPLARLEFKKAISEMVEQKKTTVIISSHSLKELQDLCDSFGVIDKSEILFSGQMKEYSQIMHKYQIAFDKVMTKEEFDIEFSQYSQEGRVIKVLCELPYDKFKEKIDKYNPLLIDEITIDFEEVFMMSVKKGGYLK